MAQNPFKEVNIETKLYSLVNGAPRIHGLGQSGNHFVFDQFIVQPGKIISKVPLHAAASLSASSNFDRCGSLCIQLD